MAGGPSLSPGTCQVPRCSMCKLTVYLMHAEGCTYAAPELDVNNSVRLTLWFLVLMYFKFRAISVWK